MKEKGDLKQNNGYSNPFEDNASDKLNDFDDIIDKIGSFGRWQFLVAGLNCFSLPVLAILNMLMPFLGYTPDHWCKVPELSSLSYNVQKNLSIPVATSSKEHVYSKCMMYEGRHYKQIAAYHVQNVTYSLPSTFYQTGTETVCKDGWIYDVAPEEVTIVTEWDLVCGKEWLAASGQSFFMLGFLLGCMGFGALSDKIGRRTTLGIALLLSSLFSSLLVISQNYTQFAILRLLLGAAQAGTCNSYFCYVVENIGRKYRNRTINITGTFYSVGYCLVGLVAWLFRNWRHMQLCASILSILLLPIYIILPESPRWLYAEGKKDECEKVLRYVAKVNKKPFPEKFSLPLDKTKHLICTTSGTREPNFFDLLKTPNLRKKTLVMMYQWFVVSMVYYGLSLGSIHLGDNKYISFALSGIVEIPAHLVCAVMMKYLGRRLTLSSSMLLGGISCLLTMIQFSESMEWMIVALATFGKFLTSVTFTTVYLYSGEIYPTVLRTIGLGSNSVFARVGAILAPYISMLGLYSEKLPLAIYGVPAVIAGALALLLPETVDRDLPETVVDGENFGKDQKFWTLLPKNYSNVRESAPSEDSAIFV